MVGVVVVVGKGGHSFDENDGGDVACARGDFGVNLSGAVGEGKMGDE